METVAVDVLTLVVTVVVAVVVVVVVVVAVVVLVVVVSQLRLRMDWVTFGRLKTLSGCKLLASK